MLLRKGCLKQPLYSSAPRALLEVFESTIAQYCNWKTNQPCWKPAHLKFFFVPPVLELLLAPAEPGHLADTFVIQNAVISHYTTFAPYKQVEDIRTCQRSRKANNAHSPSSFQLCPLWPIGAMPRYWSSIENFHSGHCKRFALPRHHDLRTSRRATI